MRKYCSDFYFIISKSQFLYIILEFFGIYTKYSTFFKKITLNYHYNCYDNYHLFVISRYRDKDFLLYERRM